MIERFFPVNRGLAAPRPVERQEGAQPMESVYTAADA